MAKIVKYFLKIGLMLLALLLALLLLFAAVQAIPAQFGYSIMGTTRHKITLLDNTPSPRLITAGGSSSPYAVDCQYLADELELPCINVGSTGYLGLEFYLSMLERYMREGDIIVIAPEHLMLRGNSTSYLTMWMAMESWPEVWQVVPNSYWPGLLRGYYEFAENKISHALDDIDQAGVHYHPDFGPLGDVTAQRETLLEFGYIRQDPIQLDAAVLSDTVVTLLNDFYTKTQAQGVQAYFAFAPVNRLALTTPPADWQALDDTIFQRLQMPVLGKLQDAIMDGVYFYDSNNHLTSEGAALYSQSLAALLADVL